MKITSIKYITGSKYELLIDKKKHIIYDDVLLEFNLYKPCEISQDTYEQIMKENSFYEGYYKAIRFINFKMRSQKEVYQKLVSLDIDKAEINKIIAKLISKGYIDNKKYAKAFILDEVNLTLNGPKKIVMMLKKKGISDSIIAKELESINADEFIANAKKYIDKKLKTYKSGSLERLKLKLKNDLYNLGYPEDYLSAITINEEANYLKDKEKIVKRLAHKYEGELLEAKVEQKLYALGYRK